MHPLDFLINWALHMVVGVVVLNTSNAISEINVPECIHRQMKNWGTSASKQKELSKMLDEWYLITTFILFIDLL